jgi:23S rRNA pseudouridine1911/1915/1917 synthase
MTDQQAAENSLSERIEIVVPAEQAGARLDRFLAQELAEISRTRIQELMEEGRVLVDGAAMKPSHKVDEGATIVIDIPPTLPAGVEAESFPLDLIYE